MQSAVDEKKKLELRVDNTAGELNKAKAQAIELESSKQQLQVGLELGLDSAPLQGSPSASLARMSVADHNVSSRPYIATTRPALHACSTLL
jgi:hypothetical protein